jgi:hypothetical protein
MTPLGIDPCTVRLVAPRLNHYATPGPLKMNGNQKTVLLGKWPVKDIDSLLLRISVT